MQSFAFNMLFMIHLLGLVAGGATSIGMRAMGGLMAEASPEQRAGYFKLGNLLRRNSHAALGMLLVSGPLMLWLRYGDPRGLPFWFWIKMALVLVLIAALILSGRAYRRVQQGDAGAAAQSRRWGAMGGLAFLGIIISAVFAFN